MIHLPVLILLAFFLAALIIPMFQRRPGAAHALALGAAAIAFALSTMALAEVLHRGNLRYFLGGWQPPIGIELVLDPLSAFLSLIITGVASLVLLHARTVVARELPGKVVPFYSTAMLLLGGLLGIVITGDLFNLYVFLEISSLATYALVALGDRRAPVASFRYLIIGTVGASFYLLGLGFLFLMTGSLNMADVAEILPHVAGSPAVTVGLILMAMGMALKMALFPMHGWLPDTYTYASSTATALLAPIGTKVAAYVLLRLFFYVMDPELARTQLPLTTVIGWLGAAGILAGSIMAIAQPDLKRMLAYSSVAQIGYIALGIGLASPYGLIGAVLHTLNHACMKACLFLVSANFLTRLGHANIGRLDESLRRRMPWTSAAFALAAISMIGLPPTAGFFSKWYLALGAVEATNWLWLAVIVISSLLNAVYFFRVLERIYLRSPEKGDPAAGHAHAAEAKPVAREEVTASMLAPTLVLGAGVLVLGLANAYIVTHVIELMIPAGL